MMPLRRAASGTGRARRALLAAGAFAWLAAGLACSTSRLTSQWKAPDYQGGRLTRLLVAARMPDSAMRRATEQGLVRDLSREDLHAIAASSVLPDSVSRDSVRAYVAREKLDGVLLVRLVSHEREVLGTNRSNVASFHVFYDDFDTVWPSPGATAFAPETEVVRVETSLYEMTGQGRLIWRIVSEEFAPPSTGTTVKDLRALVVDQLVRDHLI